MLADGSPLPPYLRSLPGSGILVVSGSIPEGEGPQTIVCQAQINGKTYTSENVTITRAALVRTTTVHAIISIGRRTRPITFSSATSAAVEVQYGVQFSLSATIDQESLTSCSTLQLVASSSPPSNETMNQGIEISWLTVTTSAALTGLFISGSPPKDVPLRTSFVFYVWVNDGARKPSVKITLTTRLSLALVLAPSKFSGGQPNASLQVALLPLYLFTPSPLVSVVVVVQRRAATASDPGSLALVCSAQIATFCSFESTSGQLTAFGTADGINNTLQQIFLATTWDPTRINTSVALVTVLDSVNPESVTLEIPLMLMPRYPAVRYRESSPLVVNATVGKPFVIDLSNSFWSPSDDVNYMLVGGKDWLLVERVFLKGIATGTPEMFFVQIVARNAYTQVSPNVSVNVSCPRVSGNSAFFQRRVSSSDVMELTLPPNIIEDPEGGEVEFEARLDSNQLSNGSDFSDSQLLPSFMQFDGSSLRFSFSPTYEDIGTYFVRVWGTTHYGSRRASASISFAVTVELSWKDFFERVYNIFGYVASGVGTICSLWLLRSLLHSMFTTKRYLRSAPPEEFLVGLPYTLSCPQDGTTLRSASVVSVQVTRLESEPRWIRIPSFYLKMQMRKPKESLQDDTIKACGVSWITLTTNDGSGSVQAKADIQLLGALVISGEVAVEDEYLLEVRGRMRPEWLWSSVMLECFVFRPAFFLDVTMTPVKDETDGTAGNYLPPSMSSTPALEAILLKQDAQIKTCYAQMEALRGYVHRVLKDVEAGAEPRSGRPQRRGSSYLPPAPDDVCHPFSPDEEDNFWAEKSVATFASASDVGLMKKIGCDRGLEEIDVVDVEELERW
jgi:hypothetical protein